MFVCGVTMELAMRTWMRQWIRPIGWTLAVAFVVALSARCATGGEMTDAQMACCAAMGHDCGPMAQRADCCSHETLRVDQFFATAKGIALAAAPFVVAEFTPTPRPFFHSGFPHLTLATLAPNRVPKYLLLSTLLI